MTGTTQAATFTWVPTGNNGRWFNEAYWSPSTLVSGNTSDVVMTNGTAGNLGRNVATGNFDYTVKSLTFNNGNQNQNLRLSGSFTGGNATSLTFSANSGNSTLKVNARIEPMKNDTGESFEMRLE